MPARNGRVSASSSAVRSRSSTTWSRRDLLRMLPGAGVAACAALHSALPLWAEPRAASSFLAAVHPFLSAPSGDEGAVDFDSSDEQLVAGFHWAKAQALQYAHNVAPVGPWYEAALPGRHAFCMRDASHMSNGAQILGLQAQNKNMLRKFAAAVSPSRDWCSYWEINSDNVPAPVDYKNDQDFWFNLPANFDVLNACYRQYLWTGDRDYLSGDFLSFYRHTVTDYVKTWEVDDTGLVGAKPPYGIRGIGSYNEGVDSIRVGADLVAAQYSAYRSFAAMERMLGGSGEDADFDQRAQHIRQLFNRDWWDGRDRRYFFAMGADGHFMHMEPDSAGVLMSLPLYFGLVDPGMRTQLTLKETERYLPISEADVASLRDGLEVRTYLPDIYYRYGWSQAGYDTLIALMDPRLYRREYPECPYTVVGNVATGLMGIGVEPSSGDLQTFPQLTRETEWAAIRHVPVRANRISVRHDGNGKTSVRNEAGPALRWRAAFAPGSGTLHVDGAKARVVETARDSVIPQRYALVTVPPGKESVVAVA
jgi:hypothetical protein